MKTSLFAVVLALMPQGQDLATFTDPFVGLEFSHPKTWTVVKKTKDTTRFSVPIEGSADKAELEVIRTAFHSSKEIWQTIQLRANETMKREVARQWEQDVINVPMLFTQVNWTDKAGAAKTTLSGLYYTRTPVKLLLRLTAPASDLERVRNQLQSALETLRTTNGSTPQEDDESVKFEPMKKPEPAPPRPKLLDSEKKPDPATAKPPVAVAATISTKPLILRLPEGWTASEVKDGKLTIAHEGLSNPISVELRYALDSEPPETALIRASAKTLNDYQVGAKRLDTAPTANRIGCRVSTVWRSGASSQSSAPEAPAEAKPSKGKKASPKPPAPNLQTFEGVASQGDFYAVLTFRSTKATAFTDEQRLVKSLLERMSLEPGQP